MAGIDTIIKQIESDCDAACDEIIARAKREAGDIISKAEKEASKAQAENAKAMETARARLDRSNASSADLERRQAILHAKYDIVDEILGKAYQRILDMNESEYVEFLLRLIDANALAKDGVCRMSSRDLERLSDQDKQAIVERAKKLGGNLSVASEPANINGGFILEYGGIEMNCSLKALFHDRHNELTDRINGILFG